MINQTKLFIFVIDVSIKHQKDKFSFLPVIIKRHFFVSRDMMKNKNSRNYFILIIYIQMNKDIHISFSFQLISIEIF
jgi:hypothetical protein